jgi:hypothetical protein
MPSPSRKIGRPRPVRATLPVSRAEVDLLKSKLDETIAAVESLAQHYTVQVQRTGQVQAAINRLTQHVQALTVVLPKPPSVD